MIDPFGIDLDRKMDESGVRKVFTPHAPVHVQDLLFGRSETVSKIINQISTPGAYPILFGDRGVGKTSIASIIEVVMRMRLEKQKKCFVGLMRCSSQESLASIFKKPLAMCGVDVELSEESRSKEESGAAEVSAMVAKGNVSSKHSSQQKRTGLEKNITPSFVSEKLLERFDHGLFIIDETDSIRDDQVKFQLAETVKLLSDARSGFKIMLVGVAELSATLTAAHPSIGRCAVETKLDRMADAEIRQIVVVGATRIKPKFDFDHDVVAEIVQMAGGYPYFAHLIALKCVEGALRDGRKFVRRHHLPAALTAAALDSEQSLRHTFETATNSATTNRYRVVVDAAAEFGRDSFSAADLRAKIAQLSGESIPQVALNSLFDRLVGENHDRILHRVSKGTYRFSDPRMPSFVMMLRHVEKHYPNRKGISQV